MAGMHTDLTLIEMESVTKDDFKQYKINTIVVDND